VKLGLTILLLVGSAVAQQRGPIPGSVEGIALNLHTGAPMPNAALRLSSTQSPAGRGGRGALSATPDFAVNTDSAGRFSFKNVGPGEYRLVPGAGYVYAGFQRDFSDPVFTVSPGQQLGGLRLRLSPLSSVAGRIIDQNDRPQSMVTVELYELVYSASGEKYLGQARGSTRTDGNGRYRITEVEAGEFYLLARPLQGRPLFPVTFYPGVIDAENAEPIRVSGSEVSNIDVQLRDEGLHSIRVKVPRPAGVAQSLSAAFTISTQSRGFFTTALMLPILVASQFQQDPSQNDVYSSPPLPPDEYIIDVTWRVPNTSFANAAMIGSQWPNPRARFTARLEDKDVDAGTIVNWTSPISIPGRVFASGLSEAPGFRQFNISLTSAEPAADSVRLPFAADGTFVLPRLTPGRYSVRAQALPAGLHLVSARLAGREVLDTIFTVEKDSTGPLEFTVAPGTGSIDGTVTLQDDPVAFARVVLVLALSRRGNPNLFVSVTTDPAGAFSFKGVPPGDYTLLAWDWVRLYSYLNPEVLGVHEGRGTEVTVGPGSQNRVSLQAVAGGG
jgi:hypothetical protein